MGGSSMTTGWNYRLAWHDDICKGPVDAVIQFNGAEKVAWKGRRTSSGVSFINKPMLWGGDKDQGGAVGPLRWMFGEAGQMPNAYLVGLLGPEQPARRGILTAVYEGGTWGANNPYQQKRSYRVERIRAGWDGDDCWYPSTAAVPLDDLELDTLIAPNVMLDSMDSSIDGSDGGFDFELPEFCTLVIELGPGSDAWSFTPSDDYQPENYSYLTWSNRFGIANLTDPGIGGGVFWLDRYATAAAARAANGSERVEIPITQAGTYRLYLYDATIDDNRGTGSYRVSFRSAGSRFAMNPAHMILFAHTQEDTGNQPRAGVNLDSLNAAADWFYANGFGLCTERKPKDESPDEFIQRIERVAGCSFSRSLVDGLFYLDVANGEYDLDSLPIITDKDVISFKEFPTVLQDAVNSVSVRYRDPERNEDVITPPVRALALAQQYGEIHLTLDYLEIPIGNIAVRVAERELLARITPTRLFELVCRPKVYGLRRSQYVRLQLPKRGIADMVVIVGEIQAGSLASGAITIKLNQDVYSLPTTVYTDVELGEDTSPPTEPAELDPQLVMEAPYMTLAGQLPAADLAEIPDGAGYVIGAASDPGRMRDFTMATSPPGGEFEEVGDSPFAPSARLTGDIEPGLELAIGYTDGRGMASIEVGDVLQIGGEIMRVDAHDPELFTLDLGRGCADTIPAKHFEGDAMLFFQRAAAYDPTQYFEGEHVLAKLLTNSWSERMPLADAPTVDVEMRNRQGRPYNNGDMKINGVSIFAVGTTTPGSGGGGGGGGGGGSSPPVRIGPSGVPLSSEPGTYGGFPDDAEYPVPQPTTVGTDIMPGGNFDDPADLAVWRKQDGSALGPEWALVDGELTYDGPRATAYAYGIRLSLPIMPFPRYTVEVTGKLRTTRGMRARFGVAWGLDRIPVYFDAADGVDYPEQGTDYPETTLVSYVFSRPVQQAAAHGSKKFAIATFMPAVEYSSDALMPSIGKLDDVTMTITKLEPVATALTPAHLDFDAGFTGWTMYADPTGNPYAPTMSVSGGEVTMLGNSQYFDEIRLICDDPITDDFEIGRYFGMGGDVLCTDPTLYGSDAGGWLNAGGVAFGYAINRQDGSFSLNTGGIAQRGDWTPREIWMRCGVDASSLPPGWTIHAMITLVVSPGYVSKVRNLWCKITDEVID